MTAEEIILIGGVLLAGFYVILGLRRPGAALITLPIVCAVFVCAAFLTETDAPAATEEAMALVPVIFLAALITVLLSGRKLDEQKWPQIWARLLLWGFALLLFIVTSLFAVANLPAFQFPFLLLVLLAITFIGAAISYGLTSRHATATYVISTIGSSMRQNLPLPMALESAAGGRDDSRARILRSISKWLVEGFSLSESIKRGFPKCPGYAAAMITAAERINQLPLAFSSIEADMAEKADESRKLRPVTPYYPNPYYPLVLIFCVANIVWAVLTFVMPQFVQILMEMTPAAQLPAATRALIQIVRFVAWDHGVLFIIALAFTVLVVFPFCIYVRFRRRRPHEPYTTSQIGDFIKWHLPVFHGFEKNYSMLQTAEMLRLSLNAGGTVNEAIDSALCLDVNGCYRKRLQKWLEKVEAGQNISAAAKQTGVGSGLAWAFDEQANQGNTPAVLETLESLYRSNYSYRVNLARFIMCPFVTLIMASIVGFVAYAIYSAPVAIIHQLAETVYP
jgi:type IV pilus assembly protein PilC